MIVSLVFRFILRSLQEENDAKKPRLDENAIGTLDLFRTPENEDPERD